MFLFFAVTFVVQKANSSAILANLTLVIYSLRISDMGKSRLP